jgi:hypothetical protein
MIPYSPLIPLVESHVALYKIYVLKHPASGEIFYVGQTLQELETRLSGHINQKDGNQPKVDYIKTILDQGQKPIIEAVEVISGTCYIDKALVNEREHFWIQFYKLKGCNLLNVHKTDERGFSTEYRGYLSSLKRGETQYRYYYCGKTFGGHPVYDEKKLKADGFALPNPTPPPVKIVEKVVYRTVDRVVYEKRPTVITEGFAASIPYDNYDEYMMDFEEDDADLEVDISDYEPEEDNDESDFEPEPLEIWEVNPETATLEERKQHFEDLAVYAEYGEYLCH